MAAPELASAAPYDPALIPTPQAALNQTGATGLPSVQEGLTYAMDPMNAPGAREAAAKQAQAADAAKAEQAGKDADLAKEAEQSRLEGEHGMWATAGTQGARGLLDVLLAPGALLGAASEGIGDLVGSKTMTDFGRDLGRAASGRSAMEAGAFLFGGGGEGGLTESEKTLKNLDEQQQAWPMLSAVSHGAGMAAAALGTGALGGLAEGGMAAAGTGARVAIGAAEGAGAGAQGAYEENAPLRDVLTSTLLGAGLGAGTAALAEGASTLYGKLRAPAAKNAAEGIFDTVPERAAVSVDQAGGKEGQAVLSELQKLRTSVREAAATVDNPTLKQEAIRDATDQAVSRLTKKAGSFDPVGWETKEPSALQKVVYRGPILDQVSGDLSQTVAKAEAMRPTMDFDLAPERVAKLVKDADAPVAIGTVQTRVKDIATELSTLDAPGAEQFKGTLQGLIGDAQKALATAELPEAMAQGHAAVKTLLQAAEHAPDDVTKSFAQRSAKALIEDMGGEEFGKAGTLYKALFTQPSEQMSALGDQAVVRDALRTTEIRGKLPAVVRDNSNSIANAYDARFRLSGEAQPKGLAQELRNLEAKFSKAEDAVTLDGGPIGKVVDFFKDKMSEKVAHTIGAGTGAVLGGYPGAILGTMVAGAIKPALKGIVPIVKEAALGATKGVAHALPSIAKAAAPSLTRAPAALLTPEEKQDQYHERLDYLAKATVTPDTKKVQENLSGVPHLNGPLLAQVTTDYTTKLQTLSADMPKPKPSIRGKAYETLSSDDVRKANAMWEATTKPLSIFEDFKAGNVDYDKVQYAWKQYPGLKQIAQAGLLDILGTQLNEQERGGIPDGLLTQLDYLFGFAGALQDSISSAFSQRMDQLGAEQAQKNQPQQGGPLKLPTSKPTYTQRLAGAK